MRSKTLKRTNQKSKVSDGGTIRDALYSVGALLRERKIDASESLLILAHVLKHDVTYVLVHPEKQLKAAELYSIHRILSQRLRGYSLASIVGYKYFYGLRFIVSSNTLVPRPDSEVLIESALQKMSKRTKGRILDIGTGSGCLIIALAKNLHGGTYTFYASDASAKALAVARKNAAIHGAKIRFIHSNLLGSIPKRRYDLVIANLPYLTELQLTEPSIQKEPRMALYGGAEGTALYARLLARIGTFLAPEYCLLLEIDPDQKEHIMRLIQKNLPKAKVSFVHDLAGHTRVAIAEPAT